MIVLIIPTTTVALSNCPPPHSPNPYRDSAHALALTMNGTSALKRKLRYADYIENKA